MPTIASWGTAEDRPEREAMRALLVGRSFMAAYREARGGEKEHRLGWSFDWVREKTAPELRWMWSSDRAYKDEHADAYAQVAGDLLLEGIHLSRLRSGATRRADVRARSRATAAAAARPLGRGGPAMPDVLRADGPVRCAGSRSGRCGAGNRSTATPLCRKTSASHSASRRVQPDRTRASARSRMGDRQPAFPALPAT